MQDLFKDKDLLIGNYFSLIAFRVNMLCLHIFLYVFQTPRKFGGTGSGSKENIKKYIHADNTYYNCSQEFKLGDRL